MSELSAVQKLAIVDYVKSIEKEKIDRLGSQITRWTSLIGISGVAIIGGLWVYFTGEIRRTAEATTKTELARLLDQDKVLQRQTAALETEIDARAASRKMQFVVDEIESRTKPLLQDALSHLETIRTVKQQLETAKGVLEAAASLTNQQDAIVNAIRNNQKFQDEVAARVGFPKNLVAAFDTSETEGSCPRGWKLFEPASGRFVVGAGDNTNKDMNGLELTYHPALKDEPGKAVGGEEKHTLKPAEMPSHAHGLNRVMEEGRTARPPDDEWGGNGRKMIKSLTEPSGGDQPHNTMPPFVALYYCIKE